MTDEIITLPVDAPAPLEIYEQEKIHPDNLKLLQQRLDRFRPLTWRERFRMERRRRKLWKLLNKKHYNLLCQKRFDLWQEFTRARDLYLKRRGEIKAQWEVEQPIEDKRRAVAELRRLKAQCRQLADQGSFVNHQIEALKPLHTEYTEIAERLEQSERMLQEDRERRKEEKGYNQEGNIIESLLLDTFARTKGCHYIWFDSRNRRHNEIPRFQRRGVNADSHWFLLSASEKTRFGWRSILPYLVDVADLTSERTLENLSAAIGRQVEVRRSFDNTQIYFHVNRLDSPDGLPIYFAFPTMFKLYPEPDHELIPFPVGVFENRRVRWFNLAHDPHILVAGKTQAGKSNFLNCMIATWIQMHSPKELRLVLIDNKGGVEFTHFKGVPHLMGDFVKSLDDVLPALQRVEAIMKDRLGLLEASGKKDIFAYNDSVDPDDKLSHIAVFIDEMQTLLNQQGWTRDVHHLLAVLGSQGRAPGIHLILCTQHPSKEVVPMPIKTNMACFVTFRMSQHASMTILAAPSAAELPRRVPGRVIVASGMEMDQAQTPFISDEDIAEAVMYALKTFGANAPAQLVSEVGDEAEAQPPKQITFDQRDVLALAIDNFEGDLKADLIYDSVKRLNVVTLRQVRQMVKDISLAGQVEYEGAVYQPVRKRKIYHLELVESSKLGNEDIRQLPEDESSEVLVAELPAELEQVAIGAD